MASYLQRLPPELLSSILEHLHVGTLLSTALTCKILEPLAIRFIYRVMKLSFARRSKHLLKALVNRLSGTLSSYVQELQIGVFYYEDAFLVLTGSQRSLALELVKKLPNLRRLIWNLRDDTIFEAIEFINSARPSCKVSFYCQDEGNIYLPLYRTNFNYSDGWLQSSDCVRKIILYVNTSQLKVVVSTREMLLACKNLRHLELTFDPPISWKPLDVSEDSNKFPVEKVFSRLESLILTGLKGDTTNQDHPCREWRNPVDLSQLITLDAKEDSYIWLLNTTLKNLKKFTGELFSWTEDSDGHFFQAFLDRNKSLHALDIQGLLEHGGSSWLAPLEKLHTLIIRKSHESNASSEMDSKDLRILAKSLPNLQSFSLYVHHDTTWPYEKLTEIAQSLPHLRHLTIQLFYSADRPVFAKDEVALKAPVTLAMTAASWCHLWKEIRLSQTSPRLKTFTIIAEYLHSAYPNDMRTFNATLSEQLEEARRGVAIVSNLEVTQMDLVAHDIKGEENRNNLWSARKIAESGQPYPSRWDQLIDKDLVGTSYGRSRLAIPD